MINTKHVTFTFLFTIIKNIGNILGKLINNYIHFLSILHSLLFNRFLSQFTSNMIHMLLHFPNKKKKQSLIKTISPMIKHDEALFDSGVKHRKDINFNLANFRCISLFLFYYYYSLGSCIRLRWNSFEGAQKGPKLLHVSITSDTFSTECFIVRVEIYAAVTRIRPPISIHRAQRMENASLNVSLRRAGSERSERREVAVTRLDSDVWNSGFNRGTTRPQSRVICDDLEPVKVN